MRARLFLALIVGLVWLVPAAASPQPRAGYQLIVHPSNPVDAVERSFVEGAFLKKVTRWPNDVVIRPAELVDSAPARRTFSDEVLERLIDAVRGYWQQRIFSGRDVPPPEFQTDAQVVEYVLKNPGAIGCVSAAAELNGAKVLTVK